MDYKFVSKKPKVPTAEPIVDNVVEQTGLLSKKTIDLLNYRIAEEELSARIYLAMHLWLEDKAYLNSAKLWKKFYEEELSHADWARQTLLSYDIKPETRIIDAVPNHFTGLDHIILETVKHEEKISKQCHDLLKYALTEDLYILPVAQKYVSEQVEELSRSYNMKSMLENFGTDKLALALLDHEFGAL